MGKTISINVTTGLLNVSSMLLDSIDAQFEMKKRYQNQWATYKSIEFI